MTRYKTGAAAKRGVRIGFIIDATASRRKTWEEAQAIQARMFKATQDISAPHLRLVHYGGDSISDLGWDSDVLKIASHMAAVFIVIGDSFAEDSDDAACLASQLKRKEIKIFSFIDGDDLTATTVFEKLATDTGGTFARFGDDLPLAALCKCVALRASGGRKALNRLETEKARLLLSGPPKTRTGTAASSQYYHIYVFLYCTIIIYILFNN